MDVQLLKENSLLNMLENKEINDKRINNIINSNIIDCEYEVKELYKLNTDNKRKLLINKHKKQLQRSPFNRNTNNIKYGDISKPLNITNRELDMNLQLSRINRNNNQCQSLVKVSTSSAFGKRLINRKNDKRTFSITSPLLNAVRRSSRLASKPKISYKEDDSENLPEKQSSGGINGYESGLAPTQVLKDNDDLKIYCKLKNESISNNEKEALFKLDDIRTCQALDTKIRKAMNYLKGDVNALKFFRIRRDQVWIKGLKQKHFYIEFGILFYNDKSKITLIYKKGRIVAPNKHKIALVKYYHFGTQNSHSGPEITLDLLEQRYWWQEMKMDVQLICQSCRTCNLAKGNTGTMALNSWVTSEPGELVFYDFVGPYFKFLYIFTILDDLTGKVMFVIVYAADAITVCDVLLQRWIPEQGFPIQLGSDIGTSNLNDLTDIFFEISGVESFFASGRRHESIGKVENVIKLLNKHLRSLNVELDGVI
jgi:hypothetical protein